MKKEERGKTADFRSLIRLHINFYKLDQPCNRELQLSNFQQFVNILQRRKFSSRCDSVTTLHTRMNLVIKQTTSILPLAALRTSSHLRIVSTVVVGSGNPILKSMADYHNMKIHHNILSRSLACMIATHK